MRQRGHDRSPIVAIAWLFPGLLLRSHYMRKQAVLFLNWWLFCCMLRWAATLFIPWWQFRWRRCLNFSIFKQLHFMINDVIVVKKHWETRGGHSFYLDGWRRTIRDSWVIKQLIIEGFWLSLHWCLLTLEFLRHTCQVRRARILWDRWNIIPGSVSNWWWWERFVQFLKFWSCSLNSLYLIVFK